MPKRVDANQKSIIAALREFGASVWDLHNVGRGPDLLVGWGGKTYPMEIKSEHGKLTKDEIDWRDSWRGNYYVVHSIEEALQIICEDEENY